MWGAAAASALLLAAGLFTVGKGLYLNANGVTTQAEVVDVDLGSRSDFVRVRFSSGQKTNLWAWTGSPQVGTTVSVDYVEDLNWARDARVFAPKWQLWLTFGLGLWWAAVAIPMERRRYAREELARRNGW
ncbi:hypothetical protein GA0074692_3945 [Micromonospora pallida]|uniref:DUF3592 domain-containing protein n=1 Tax=Micromonospora pallida TaxID=145854 RepID=A0A1C6SZP9_9ACTN|nr:hypothetical protein [Micromonospora pallida]SCL34869.1 hypothetical protein GA0074692_3945 [Micromonospora pallida]